MNKRDDVAAAGELELRISHTFKAPRALVFQAWTTVEHLARWSGPHGFTSSHHEIDLRPGGFHRACLHAPDGSEHWMRGVYREIVAPERLVFTHAWEDANGKLSKETLVTITFVEQDGQTLMTVVQTGFESVASRDGHGVGWTSSFERLDTCLDGMAA